MKGINHFSRSKKPNYIFIDYSPTLNEQWIFYVDIYYKDTDSVGVWHIKYKNSLTEQQKQAKEQ